MTRHGGYRCEFTIRTTEREWQQLLARAQRAGLSLSRYLVESGLTSLPPVSPEEQAQRQRAIFHARKIGVNLNQIARQLNSQLPLAEEELAAALVAAAAALRALTGARETS
jgi:hypothetical protein